MKGLHDLPNLRHLRAFSLTARYRSVKRAAAAIYLSQPAVTQAIGKLEDRFGLEFFQRRKTGMYCTPFGEALRFRVDRALNEIARACRPGGSERAREAEGDDPGRMITTAQLRAVIAIADHGNFTLAARSLGISQPSMHRTARSLEHALGLRLFSRSGQGIGLSAAGERVARGAKLAAREIELAFEELEFLRGQKTGRIVIGAMPLARVDIVPLAVTRLLERYPDLRISIVEGPYSGLLRGLRSGEIDVVIGALRDPAPMPDVVERVLFTEPLSVVVRAGHPLTRIGAASLSDTIGYPWVVPRPDTPTREHFHAIFRTRALSEPKRLLEVSSHVSLRALLMESDRVTLLSRQQIRYEEAAGQLCALPIDLDETNRPIGLTTRQDWEPTLPQRELLDELATASRPQEAPALARRTEPGAARFR